MQQTPDDQATSTTTDPAGYPTLQQQAKVKEIATRAAYQALARLNKTQQKVTEEEVRVIATESAVYTQIANYPASHGEPDHAMRIYIEAYTQVWREGLAVVSPLQLTAIRQAQDDKRKDAQSRTIAADLVIIAKARAGAIIYVVGEKATREIPQSQEINSSSTQLTEQELEQASIYAEAYIKHYQLYQVPTIWRKVRAWF